ncbi:outer membrane beta-barrel protein [Porphyromonas loveana]|uniref:outer membrane beta-barrel protein n=1 Tax=Porphyromonas loveana TaxID=1884669 RepID=UPI0035A00861
MKKFLSLMLLAFSALSASAGIEIGVTGGYNLTHVSFDRASLSETLSGKNGSGWYVGPKINLGLMLGLSLDAAAVYNQRKYSFENVKGLSTTYTSKTIDVPINLKLTIPIAAVGVYVATGPQFAYNVGDKKWDVASILGSSLATTSSPSEWDRVFDQQNMTTTWNVGAGVLLGKTLEVGLVYNIGLGKVGEGILSTVGIQAGATTPSYKTNTFSAQATLYF